MGDSAEFTENAQKKGLFASLSYSDVHSDFAD